MPGIQIANTATVFSRANMPTLFKPSTFIANLLGWWSADSGVTLDGNNRVSLIVDQGPAGNNLAPLGAGGTNAPLNLPNTQAGKPGFYNDNAGNIARWVQVNNPFPAGTWNKTLPFTHAIAMRKVNNSANVGLDVLGGCKFAGSTSGFYMIMSAGVVSFVIQSSTVGTEKIVVKGSTVLVSGKTYIIAVTYDGSALASGVKVYINGTLETMTVVTDTIASALATGAQFHVGSNGGNSDANIHFEQTLYNRALTAAEVATLSVYMNQRWLAY